MSQEALLDKDGEKPNYEVFFSNEEWIKKFNEAYNDKFGVVITDDNIIKCFVAKENGSDDQHWKDLRVNLGITANKAEKKTTEGGKTEEKKECTY